MMVNRPFLYAKTVLCFEDGRVGWGAKGGRKMLLNGYARPVFVSGCGRQEGRPDFNYSNPLSHLAAEAKSRLCLRAVPGDGTYAAFGESLG